MQACQSESLLCRIVADVLGRWHCGQGTAMTEASEFWDVYGLGIQAVPTNKPTRRKDFPPRLFMSTLDKYNWILRSVRYPWKGIAKMRIFRSPNQSINDLGPVVAWLADYMAAALS